MSEIANRRAQEQNAALLCEILGALQPDQPFVIVPVKSMEFHVSVVFLGSKGERPCQLGPGEIQSVVFNVLPGLFQGLQKNGDLAEVTISWSASPFLVLKTLRNDESMPAA